MMTLKSYAVMLSLQCGSGFFLSLTLFWFFAPKYPVLRFCTHCVENTALNIETAELGSVLHSRDQNLT